MQCKLGYTNGAGDTYPCGQCMPCRINKGRQWTARILLEDAFHEHYSWSWFLTLTFNDKSVWKTDDDGIPTLRKKKFRKWVENTMARKSGPFRFYAIGEYGETTFRPHYHMAIFPRSDSQVGEIAKAWKYGYCSAYPLTPERAGYLAQYTTKKLTKAADPRLKRTQEPEHRSSSRNPPLGAASIRALVNRYSHGAGSRLLAERGDIERTVRIGGRVYPLPQYIQTKVRQELGIPETHTGRIDANPRYLDYFHQEEAEWNPEKHDAVIRRIDAKKRLKRTNKTVRV